MKKYEHLMRIPVKLTILSPLHIGSGEKIGQKEFILDAQNECVMIPDVPTMIDFFMRNCRKNTLEMYERFVLGGRGDLSQFFYDQQLRAEPDSPFIRRTDSLEPGIGTINTLGLFHCNAEGDAYIPGSSIKGALRTAFIAGKNEEEKAKYRAGFKTELETNSRRNSCVEDALRVLRANDKRRQDAVNDLFRGVHISDCAPFESEDTMTVCRRHWIGEDGTQKAGLRGSPVYQECVRPGVTTQFYLTLDGTICDPDAFLRKMTESLIAWNALCVAGYEGNFCGAGFADVETKPGYPMVLGSGTGFQRKSLVYAMFDQNEAFRLANGVLGKQFGRTYKPRADSRSAPYMMKGAYYNRALYRMGMCRVEFQRSEDV